VPLSEDAIALTGRPTAGPQAFDRWRPADWV